MTDEHRQRLEKTAVDAILEFDAAISALGLSPSQRQAVFHQFSLCVYRLLSGLVTSVIIARQDHEEDLIGQKPNADGA